MNGNEFQQYGGQMIDFVANYWKTLRKRDPFPDVKPGFIYDLVGSFIEIARLCEILNKKSILRNSF